MLSWTVSNQWWFEPVVFFSIVLQPPALSMAGNNSQDAVAVLCNWEGNCRSSITLPCFTDFVVYILVHLVN